MNQKMSLSIANAHSRINVLHELHNNFLQHLEGHAIPEGLPANITIQNHAISVNCFGHVITAEPKVVTDGQDLYAVEYVFYAREGENEEELWRFYLTSDGRLEGSLEQNSPLCDFDNRFIAKYICEPVMYTALKSILFKPTERHEG